MQAAMFRTQPLRRGPEDEDEDFESVVQKMSDQNFDEWPNEAGVRSHTATMRPWMYTDVAVNSSRG